MKPSPLKRPFLIVMAFLLVGIHVWLPVARVYAAGIVVTTSADTATNDGNCSLREAVGNANSDSQIHSDCGGVAGQDTITFAAGVTSITLNSPLPSISDSVGLIIDGAGAVTINGAGSFRIFTVNNTAARTLTGLTITNGNAGTSYGGAVYNQGILVVSNSRFTDNAAQFGGAILSWGWLNHDKYKYILTK